MRPFHQAAPVGERKEARLPAMATVVCPKRARLRWMRPAGGRALTVAAGLKPFEQPQRLLLSMSPETVQARHRRRAQVEMLCGRYAPGTPLPDFEPAKRAIAAV